MRKRVYLLGAAVVAVLILGVLLAWYVFKVRLLVVGGCINRPVSEIAKLSEIKYGDNIFFLRLDEVKEKINQNPYYEVQSVERDLPSTIRIRVRERQPSAILEMTNEVLIIDSTGFVLEKRPNASGLELPVIKGLMVNTYQVGERIVPDQAIQLTAMNQVLSELENQKMIAETEEINFSSVNDILLYTRDGRPVEVGNTYNIETKIRFLRAVLEDLRSKGIYDGLINVASGNSATYSPELYSPGEIISYSEPAEPLEKEQEKEPETIVPEGGEAGSGNGTD